MATKVGFGLAIEKHRIYVLAVCAHCGAVVTMTSTKKNINFRKYTYVS